MILVKVLVTLVGLYLLWRLCRLLFFYFTEYFVLWVVANGGNDKRRSMSTKMRLHVYVCPTELMDGASVIELYKFLNNHLDSSVTIKGFYKVLLSYTYAVLFRERRDGSLRGLFVLSLDRVNKDDMSYTVLRPGLSFFEKEYRGGPYYYYIFAYFCIKEFILHPLTPFYMFGKSFSYKSYSVLTHSLSHVYPSYNRNIPDNIKRVIDEFASKVKLPNEEYDTDRCVLMREHVRMKEFVSEPRSADINDPNVKYFFDINPGWEKGHQLLTLSLVDLRDIIRVVFRMFSKAIKGRRANENQKRPKYERRNTFQSDSANTWSKKVLHECDINGDHHPAAEYENDSMQDLSTLLS